MSDSKYHMVTKPSDVLTLQHPGQSAGPQAIQTGRGR